MREGLTVLLVLVLATAGCIGGKDEPVEPAQANTTDELTPEETVAPDGRGDISAFKETNKTEMGAGGEMHAHDYWQGKDRIEIGYINSGLIPFPFMPCNDPAGCTLGGSSKTYPPGTAIADYDLPPVPEAGLVYEGTKEMELTLVAINSLADGTPPNPLGKVYFDYLTASDDPNEFRTGGELKLNEPFKIPVAPTEADMPHQTKSLWIFRIYSNSEMITFGFNISVTAIRGYDVVNWPPHPDLYADKPDRIVHDGIVKHASKGTPDYMVFGTAAGYFYPERVISWGTDRLEIEISNVKFTTQTAGTPLAPNDFALEYHNASDPLLMANGDPYGEKLTDAGSDGTTWRFAIDLTQDDGRAYDTPYGQHSRWGFRFVPVFENGDTQLCVPGFDDILMGCQFSPWEIEYSLKITAYGHSTAGGAPEAR